MSRMPDTKRRRPRRQCDEEFRSQAVRLVLDDGKTIAIVCARSGSDTVGAAVVGATGPGGSHERSHRAHDGGARGARAPAERESRAADRARNLKKSRGRFNRSMQQRSQCISWRGISQRLAWT